MNNKEYMEYEGYRIIEAALLSYTSPAGSLLSAAPGNHGLVWDYILFRLYLAEKTIRRFPSGFGCMDENGQRPSGRVVPPFPYSSHVVSFEESGRVFPDSGHRVPAG